LFEQSSLADRKGQHAEFVGLVKQCNLPVYLGELGSLASVLKGYGSSHPSYEEDGKTKQATEETVRQALLNVQKVVPKDIFEDFSKFITLNAALQGTLKEKGDNEPFLVTQNK